MKAEEMLRQNDILQEKNNQLAAKLAEENAVTASLQKELKEKQAEINRIKSTQKDLTQEIKHNKIRMPTSNTKVEVVTYLAEVETDIIAAKELATGNKQQIFEQANRSITESKAELERGNYDAARSQASQAMKLTQDIRIKTALNRKVAPNTSVDFTAPLHLQIAKQSNIRKKPTMEGEISVILPPKTPVTASGYQGNWIKVTCKNGQEGWVHYSLLTVPETTLPFPKPVQ